MFMYYEQTTDVKYCQCKLQKGDTITTTWIPEKYAIKGKYIKLLDDNGWQVIEAGIPIDGNYVFRHERDFTKQRKASDI
jgi:hypothetical protein